MSSTLNDNETNRKKSLKQIKGEMRKKKSSSIENKLLDPMQNAIDFKLKLKNSTGIVYDPLMLEHFNPFDSNHIECPQRLQRSYENCQQLGLIERCVLLPSRMANDDELLLTHSKRHLDCLSSLANEGLDKIQYYYEKVFHSVYMNQSSMKAARFAAGGAIDLTSAVVKETIQNGFAFIRPPGHHAMTSEACGFCLFNNVAIAARHSLNNLGVKKILILDFDIHHGQATQQEFLNDPRVLYISIHRYENGKFWPHLRASHSDIVGTESGKGFNANIPLNETGMSDSDYLAIFHNLILPMAYEFNPELVLISAGYDAAIGCPEGEMELSPMIYGHIISSMMSLAAGKIVVLLEGGYFVESLAQGVAMSLRALLGDHSCLLGTLSPLKESLVDSILNSITFLRPYWNILSIHETYKSTRNNEIKSNSKSFHIPNLVYEGDEIVDEKNNKIVYLPGNHYINHSEEKIIELKEQLLNIMKKGPISKTKNNIPKITFAYNKEMLQHCNIDDNLHPERPLRISSIYDLLKSWDFLSRSDIINADIRRATQEEICTCHSEDYFKRMSEVSSKNQSELNDIADTFDSIYLNQFSFDCALLASGMLLNVIDNVMNENSQKGIAVIRPPGHHAENDEACGFCIFNNVAIAAKYSMKVHDVKKVLILDWDIHHGNGIQDEFYEDPNILYISLHRYDNGTFFPSRKDANYDFVGENSGKGFNINIAWNESGIGDAEYMAAFFNIILPVAYEFNPELILISAGFDAAIGDPLGKCEVSPETYGHIINHLQNLSESKIVLALEGGYNLNSISHSMAMCAKALLGDPIPPINANFSSIKKSAIESIRKTMKIHSNYWNCLKFGKKLPLDNLIVKNLNPNSKKKVKSSFTPFEYGLNYSTCSTNTISTSSQALHHEENRLVDSGSEPQDKLLVNEIDGLCLGNSSEDVISTSDYIPFEYGYSGNSSTINTISNSSTAPKCKTAEAGGHEKS